MSNLVNHKKYKQTCLDLFQNFLNNPTDKDNLINGLKAIETELSKGKKTNKSLWFRFFKEDSLATTIQNIENDLKYNRMVNYCDLEARFNVSIYTKELQIYFS